MRQKGSALIAIFLVLTILSVIGYLSYSKGYLNIFNSKQTFPTLTKSPSPDETEEWAIYENDEVGFSLKYPKTLISKPELIKKEYGEVLRAENKQFTLVLSTKAISDSTRERKNMEKLYNKEQIKQVGSSFVYIDQYVSAEGWFQTNAKILSDNYLITFSIFPLAETPDKSEQKASEAIKLRDQILSTFKFID